MARNSPNLANCIKSCSTGSGGGLESRSLSSTLSSPSRPLESDTLPERSRSPSRDGEALCEGIVIVVYTHAQKRRIVRTCRPWHQAITVWLGIWFNNKCQGRRCRMPPGRSASSLRKLPSGPALTRLVAASSGVRQPACRLRPHGSVILDYSQPLGWSVYMLVWNLKLHSLIED